jgi:hypothetical protein
MDKTSLEIRDEIVERLNRQGYFTKSYLDEDGTRHVTVIKTNDDVYSSSVDYQLRRIKAAAPEFNFSYFSKRVEQSSSFIFYGVDIVITRRRSSGN